jgi:hypothetical protein
MSTRVDVEEIQTTRSEKLLASVLVVAACAHCGGDRRVGTVRRRACGSI